MSEKSDSLDELKCLSQSVIDKWRKDPLVCTTVMDPYLFKILCWIHENLDKKSEVVDYFLSELDKQENFPQDIIEYCMYYLRWPEIQEAVQSRIQSAEDPRTIDALRDIESVYLGTWDYLDMFPRLQRLAEAKE